MLKDHSSLLDKIKSKYILHKILLFAFSDMNSLLKLIRYNKNLINKLEINIKDYYNYKIKIKIRKKKCGFFIFNMVIYILLFILFLIYIIMFYKKGTFNNKNLKEEYNVKKKYFVDFMDNYILLTYFCFIIAAFFILILLYIINIFYLKQRTKIQIYTIIGLIDLFHFISYVIKTFFTTQIVKEIVVKNDTSLNLIWFYNLDICLSIFLCFNSFYFLLFF